MYGMIKKDLFVIGNNIKPLILSLVIYFCFAFTNNMGILFIIPFYAVMICTSTFSYDDYSNWHTYAVTLPDGRNNVVKSKYITAVLLTITTSVIGLGLSVLVGMLSKSLDLEDILSSIGGSLCAILILISILYPALFKFGSEKGRVGLFIICFGIAAIIMLFSKVVNIRISDGLKLFVNTYGWIVFSVFSIIAIIISYLISRKIYNNKEF